MTENQKIRMKEIHNDKIKLADRRITLYLDIREYWSPESRRPIMRSNRLNQTAEFIHAQFVNANNELHISYRQREALNN